MINKFVLLLLFFLFLQTEIHSVEVSTPEFPIFIQSDNHTLANRTISHCNEYVKFLYRSLNCKKITPITVFLGAKNYLFYKYMITSKIYINIDDSGWENKLMEQIATSVINDLSIDARENTPVPPIPLFVPVGIAGIYLKSKIDPSYEEIHNKLVDSDWITLQNLIKITEYQGNGKKNHFILESIYFMEYIQYNSPKNIVKNFLHKYADNPESALDFLTEDLGFDTLEKLEKNFYQKVKSKKVIYNIISSQNRPFKNQNILQRLDEIMTFECDYYKTGKKIILRADEIKIGFPLGRNDTYWHVQFFFD